MKQRECVYVVGAGFSAGLGYPLTSDLLFRLWEKTGDDNFKEKLGKVIRFHHPGFKPERFASFPNVEQLLSEMLVNEQLFDASRQYEGKFTKADLQQLQKDLLLKIADWFHDISKARKPDAPQTAWLKQFQEQVYNENAAIISFNWDLELDWLLFRRGLNSASYGFSNYTSNQPILLKPHGSLNWFEEKQGKFLSDSKRTQIFTSRRKGAVYAFLKFRAPTSKVGRTYTPLIIPPVYLKSFDKPIFKALWRKCTSVLSTAKRIVILGYSMPSADLHAQFIMRCGFHNQKEGELGKAGKRKTATGSAEVIIVNPDRAAAERIEAVVGTDHNCQWVSMPAAEWIRAVVK